MSCMLRPARGAAAREADQFRLRSGAPPPRMERPASADQAVPVESEASVKAIAQPLGIVEVQSDQSGGDVSERY